MPRPQKKPALTPELGALGQAVRSRRKALGYTQEEVGRKRFTDHKLAGKIERGHRNPSYMTLVLLAEALETDTGEIVGLAARYFREGRVGVPGGSVG